MDSDAGVGERVAGTLGWAALPTVFGLSSGVPVWRRSLYAVLAALLPSGMGSDNWEHFD